MILASNTQQHKEKHPKKRRGGKIKRTCRKGRKQKGLGLRFTAAWETQQM
jgi:hypothetical protein